MGGMNAHTGKAISGIAHINQSVADILLTPMGSRVMRRDYGSLVPDLLDQPLNDTTVLQLYASTVIALQQWEPRIVIERVGTRIDPQQEGRAVLTLEVMRLDTGMQQRAQLTVNLGTQP